MRTPTTAIFGPFPITACLVAATLTVTSGEQALPRATPESVGLSGAGLEQAGAVLRQAVADQQIAGAVGLVARRGQIVYLDAVGSQDLEPRVPMQERSLFRIYSMTRAITSAGIMMLVESGQIALADPVRKFLPDFASMVVQEKDGARRKPVRDITVEDLLLHTSGISDRNSELYRELKVRSRSIGLPQLLRNIAGAPLMEDPGTRFRYGESTSVLGGIIEAVSKRPLDVFFKERVLQPLGMIDTSFWVDGEARSRLTTAYRVSADGLAPFEIEEVPFTDRPQLLEGTVGLVSSAPDYFRFSQMLLNGGEWQGQRLLTAPTVAKITSNGLPAPVLQQRSGGAMGWGLANFEVVITPNSRGYLTSPGEYGWDGSAGGFVSINPAFELIVLLMTQNVPANPNTLRQRFKAAVMQSIVAGASPGARGLETCPPAGWPQARLDSLKQEKFAITDAPTLRSLALALPACLGDPNPALRDGIAFEALSTWMRGGAIDVATLTELREHLLRMLDAPDAEGFRRPFAALVLSEVARTDRLKPWMSDQDRERVVTAAAGFLSGVKDYRGFSNSEGWRHGVAHGADLILQLALNSKIARPQLDRLLTAIASQIAPTSTGYHSGEPDRLARPVLFIAQRDLHSEAEWESWFAGVLAPAPLPSWDSAFSSEAGIAKRHNTRAFLLSVYANANTNDNSSVRRLIAPVLSGLKTLP